MTKQVPQQPIHRVGLGTDLHRLAPGRKLIIGHIPIEYDRGPVSHSDGDVLLHAVIDALAGAAGLPDIGEMFPDNDPAHAGADSGELLSEVVQRVADQGFGIVNLDATIHAQQPSLKPYKQRIRQEVARLLEIGPEAVSIKAKTNEEVDAVGRREAIACSVVVGLNILNDG